MQRELANRAKSLVGAQSSGDYAVTRNRGFMKMSDAN